MLEFFDLRHKGISPARYSQRNVAKIYPDGTGQLITWRQPRIIQSTGWLEQKAQANERRILLASSHIQIPQVISPKNSSFENQQARKNNDARSIRRTRTVISDLIRANEFDLFVTFTFAENRQDAQACFDRLHAWLNSQQSRHGKFRYLLVPERHKDNAVHFHALFGDFTGKMKFSGVQQRGKKVFNLTGWRHGFTNATKIQNKEKTASYCRKYITKDLQNLPWKKRYWSSQGLLRPLKIDNVFENKQVKIQELSDAIYTTDYFQIQKIQVELGSTINFIKKYKFKEKQRCHKPLQETWTQLSIPSLLLPEPPKSRVNHTSVSRFNL